MAVPGVQAAPAFQGLHPSGGSLRSHVGVAVAVRCFQGPMPLRSRHHALAAAPSAPGPTSGGSGSNTKRKDFWPCHQFGFAVARGFGVLQATGG